MTVAPTRAFPGTTNAAGTSAVRNRPTPVPTLRLLPVPRSAPRYDDERHDAERYDDEPTARHDGRCRADEADVQAGEAAVQGALALAFTLPGGLPVEPEPSPALRVVAHRDDEDHEFRPRPTPRAALPDPRSWAASSTCP